jgi:hypothetical protein
VVFVNEMLGKRMEVVVVALVSLFVVHAVKVV